MNQKSKLIQSFIVGFLSLAIASGCTKPKSQASQETQSDKVEIAGNSWYDYGNGLINLSRVTRITSQANLSVQVMTRKYHENERDFYAYYQNLSDEGKAIAEGHADFCFDNVKSKLEGDDRRSQHSWRGIQQSATLGAFESGGEGRALERNISELKGKISPEVAEVCVIRLRGEASLNFDNFTVKLAPFEKILVFQPDTQGKFTKESVDQQFDESLGELANGKTPWDGEYASLFNK